MKLRLILKKCFIGLAYSLFLFNASWAQTAPISPLSPNSSNSPPVGSTAFCLFPIAGDSETPSRYLNLGIVQYIDVRSNDVLVVYGGGNFGGGHEIKLPAKTREEAQNWLNKMRLTAEDCARRPSR